MFIKLVKSKFRSSKEQYFRFSRGNLNFVQNINYFDQQCYLLGATLHVICNIIDMRFLYLAASDKYVESLVFIALS